MFTANCDSLIISKISSSDSIEIYFLFTRRMFKSKLWRGPWVLEFLSPSLTDQTLVQRGNWIEESFYFNFDDGIRTVERLWLLMWQIWGDSLALNNVVRCHNECYSLYRIYIVCVSLDKTPSPSTQGRAHLVLPCYLFNWIVHWRQGVLTVWGVNCLSKNFNDESIN